MSGIFVRRKSKHNVLKLAGEYIRTANYNRRPGKELTVEYRDLLGRRHLGRLGNDLRERGNPGRT